MKKRKLIEMLSHLKDDDEVYFWNPLVHDWMDFDPKVVTTEMCKIKTKVRHAAIVQQWRDRGETYTRTIKEMVADSRKNGTHQWETFPFVMDEEYAKIHDFKTFHFLQTKNRGKTSLDRCGSIGY